MDDLPHMMRLVAILLSVVAVMLALPWDADPHTTGRHHGWIHRHSCQWNSRHLPARRGVRRRSVWQHSHARNTNFAQAHCGWNPNAEGGARGWASVPWVTGEPNWLVAGGAVLIIGGGYVLFLRWASRRMAASRRLV